MPKNSLELLRNSQLKLWKDGKLLKTKSLLQPNFGCLPARSLRPYSGILKSFCLFVFIHKSILSNAAHYCSRRWNVPNVNMRSLFRGKFSRLDICMPLARARLVTWKCFLVPFGSLQLPATIKKSILKKDLFQINISFNCYGRD